MSNAHKPAGPRSHLVGGFALGAVLLGVAYWTFPNPHVIWEIPVGLFLVVVCMGKMAAR